jgi:thioredoxin-dependent peroxiredoxin
MISQSNLISILGTAFVVLAIMNATSVKPVDTNSSVSALPGTGQSGAPTDDHHGGGAPADSTQFDSLLGKKAPDFTLEDFDGNKISLSSLRGQKVILFFNEGLMCYPACWNQIAAFGKDDSLAKEARILNITVDPKNKWNQAIAKMPDLAAATVLFDENNQVSNEYGVLTLPSSMHRGEFPGHSYVIINEDGVIVFARDDASMAVRNNELSAEIARM